jgi:NAD+ synthase (glutamine-hydrolysing)
VTGFGPRVRLRVEQFAPVLGDAEANLAHLAAAQADAARDGVDVLVTPELALTGYDVRDRVHALAVPQAERPFPELSDGPDVVLGLVERDDAFVPHNAALHLRRGAVLHRHHKVYLPTYGMFDEGRYFGRGDRVRAYDAGGGWRMGLLVCEDLWHPALTYLLAAGGARLLVALTAPPGRGVPAPDAGPSRFASAASWEHLARAAAAAYGVYVVLANRVGVEGGAVFGGGSLIVAPGGDVLARGDDLAADRPTAELSLDAVASARRPYAHARDDDPHLVLRELRHLLGESG